MRLFAFAIFIVTTAVTAFSLCLGEPAHHQVDPAPTQTLVGQLLLPPGSGSRGVEVVATFTETGREPRDQWILFDEEGRFSDTVRGYLGGVVVSNGHRIPLYAIEADNLPEGTQTGHIDLGVIDLRDRLVSHRLTLRAAEGASQGNVRVGMFFGLPPVGPRGEPVSLGSRQFPPVALGSEMEWLLQPEVQSLYFLVERPVGPAHEPQWRGGYQRLFGPFSSPDLPTELIMD